METNNGNKREMKQSEQTNKRDNKTTNEERSERSQERKPKRRPWNTACRQTETKLHAYEQQMQRKITSLRTRAARVRNPTRPQARQKRPRQKVTTKPVF